MGCSQSKKTSDQIVERVSVERPAVEAPTPVHSDGVAPVVAIETLPTTTEEAPLACASVPVDDGDEASTTKEVAAAPVEEKAEKLAESAADRIEEVTENEAAASISESSPVPQTDAPMDEVSETPASIEEESITQEEKVFEEESETLTLQLEPHGEDEATKSEATAEALVDGEDESKPEGEGVVSVSKAKPVESSLTFKAENVTFNDKGVAFYNFDGLDLSNPVNDVHISKRYSDFKALHAQLTGKDGKVVVDLPALPTASFLQGRNNKEMLEDRKTQFTALLNAIAENPLALQSDLFKAFLA